MKRAKPSHLPTVFVLILGLQSNAGQCPPMYIFTGASAYDNLGTSVASAGDINNDGFYDIVIGAYTEGSVYDTGEVYIYSGWNGDTLYQFYSAAPGDAFGYSVSSAGDVNNDGFADVIVGAPYPTYYGRRAYVFSGMTGDTLFVFKGDTNYYGFGTAVVCAGDVNNDGFDDIIIGEPSYGSPPVGRAIVFSGRTGDTLFIFSGEGEDDLFGYTLSTAGDVNNDSYDDILIGALLYSVQDSGRVYIFSGLDGDTLGTFTGKVPGDYLGQSVSSAGDVNNDGYDDIIISTERHVSYPDGIVYVFSGFDMDTLHIIKGNSFERFGHSVASAGDVDNDGFDDVIVSALFAGNYTGQVYVFSGLSGDTLLVFDGESYSDWFGYSVSSAGDTDNDGKNDILIGARHFGDADAGRAYVFSGSSCIGYRGDLNADGFDANILDLTYLVDRIFRGGPIAACIGEADVNADGQPSNIIDLTFIVDRIFRGGPAPGACY